jgi:hypothetical protein
MAGLMWPKATQRLRVDLSIWSIRAASAVGMSEMAMWEKLHIAQSVGKH